jgi:transposase
VLSLNPHQRYFLYQTVTDMRKGINGLNGLIREYLQQDPMSGDVFIFLNKRRDRIKLLMWDRTGYALYYKQLEKGTFELPGSGKMGGLELSWSELAMLLDGIELGSIKRRKRYIKVA